MHLWVSTINQLMNDMEIKIHLLLEQVLKLYLPSS